MIGSKKYRKLTPRAHGADQAAAATPPSTTAAAPSISPAPATGDVPAGAVSDATAKNRPVSIPAKKPGPGRPPSAARCVRCHRRVERCRCKEGVLLTGDVERALERDKNTPAKIFDKDEAEQILRMVLYGLGMAETMVAKVLSRMTWNEASQIWSYNESEVRALLPPAQKVLAKYADRLPSLLTKYASEIALGFAFLQVTQAKMMRSTELLARKSAAAAPPTKPAPVISIDRTETAAPDQGDRAREQTPIEILQEAHQGAQA